MSRRALALAAAATAVAAFLGTLVGVDDPDTFHHLAVGRELAARGFFEGEPFLFPLRGAATMPPPHWLGSLAIYGWVRAFGEGALAFLPALVAAVLAIVLVADSVPRSGRLSPALAVAGVPLALAFETFRYRAVARPELLATFLVAVVMWALRRLEDGRPRLLLAFPALALLWANVHPSTLAGVAPIAVHVGVGAAALLASRALRRPLPFAPPARQVVTAAAVAVAAIAVSLVNPSPANPVLGAFRFAVSALRLGDGAGAAAPDPALEGVTRFVGEMQGVGASVWGTPVGVLIALTGLSFLLRWRAPRPRELATVALFAALPFGAVRFAILFAVVAAPICARNLVEAAEALPERLGRVPARAAAAATGILAAVATFPLGMQAPHIRFGTGLVPAAFPVRAADYLVSIGFDGRIFNTFQLGGYLEWRRAAAPYQDGRGLVPPREMGAAIAGPSNPALFAALDRKYRFDAVLVDVPVLGPEFLRALAVSGRRDDWVLDRRTWSLVAFDDGGLLYLRRDGRHAGPAARDEYRFAVPASPSALPALDVREALGEYRRSLAEAPWCVRCGRAVTELARAAGEG